MAKPKGFFETIGKKYSNGFYENVYDKVQFNERMHQCQEYLPGTYNVERIISSRGTTKVRHIFLLDNTIY